MERLVSHIDQQIHKTAKGTSPVYRMTDLCQSYLSSMSEFDEVGDIIQNFWLRRILSLFSHILRPTQLQKLNRSLETF